MYKLISFDHRSIKFGKINHVGDGRFSGYQTRRQRKGRDHSASKIPGPVAHAV